MGNHVGRSIAVEKSKKNTIGLLLIPFQKCIIAAYSSGQGPWMFAILVAHIFS